MSEQAPAVALLFDDTTLGGQLKEALTDCGARIVHEGGVSSLTRELLEKLVPDVLVVNLDEGAADALDDLYDLIDGDRPRVVFNDAQASRSLEGWDRARWARHLAVKVLEAGDLDPPRPEHAREIDIVAASATMEPTADAEPTQVTYADTPNAPSADDAGELLAVHASPPALAGGAAESHPDGDGEPLESSDWQGEDRAVESEDLAAELEALLASGELSGDDDIAGPGLRTWEDGEPPALHDGHFGAPAEDDGLAPGPDLAEATHAEAMNAGAPAPSVSAAGAFRFDHLQLTPMDDLSIDPPPAVNLLDQIPTGSFAAPSRAPDEWALLDADEVVSDPALDGVDAASGSDSFGIHKLSAAEFLAPDVESVDDSIRPTMSLELVSMEEAVAPMAYQPISEMVLDHTATALSRLVVLGAAAVSHDSVQAFLSALPPATRQAILHTQHMTVEVADLVIEQFAQSCHLPVRLAEANSKLRTGEVVVVPVGQQVRLRRDGHVELLPDPGKGEQSPSIDASLTMAANLFGRDTLAIIFSGPGTDGFAGAQAVHDRGGQVWVESSSDEHHSNMVNGIVAERLVSFSGTPSELAAHLVEVFS